MTRIVVMTAARPQFDALRAFLQSYATHVEDAPAVPVHVVAARDDLRALEALLAEFGGLDVHARALEDFLEPAGHGESAAELVRAVGRGTADALARLYALAALPFDQALVLDGDGLAVGPVRLASVFDAYFAGPRVFYSDPAVWGEAWFGSTPDSVVKTAARMLGVPYPDTYFGEYRGGFYEKRVVRDVFAALGGDPLRALRSRVVGEPRLDERQLVWTYVAANRARYPYRFESAADLLRTRLGADAYAAYLHTLAGGAPETGLLDSAGAALTEANFAAIARVFADERLRFYHFDPRNRNGELQRRLIEAAGVAFVVASPEYRRRRVAVCVSGMPRNARQNARFLRNFLSETEVDLFAHFWDTPDREFLVQALRPTAYLFEPTSAAPAPQTFARLEKLAPERRARDNASMHYSISRANALKSAYEAEHGFRYDVVVRLRLDLFSTQTLEDVFARIRELGAGWDRVLYVPDQMMSAGLNDQFALGSSETMDVYAAHLDALPAVAAGEWFHPEYLLLRHLLRNGLRIRAIPFEYLLLRGERMATFDLPGHVKWIFETWWAPPLGPIPPRALNDYLAAQAESARVIDELDVDFPRVFRVRCASRGYLRYDQAARALGFTPEAAAAGLFYVVIPPDENQTVVNVRPRDLVVGAVDEEARDAADSCFYPDATGHIRPDGPTTEDSEFYIRRLGAGVVLEWRSGFWRSPADVRTLPPRVPGGHGVPLTEDAEPRPRLVLQPSDSGLALVPLSAETEAFELEYVPDRVAEQVPLGLNVNRSDRSAPKPVSLPVRALRLTYLAARLVDQRGVRVMGDTARDYLRKRASLAAQGDRGGVLDGVLRRLAKRL